MSDEDPVKIIDELIYGEMGNEVVLIKYLTPAQLGQ